MRKKVLILGLCLLGVTHSLSSKDKKSIPLYKDAKAPIEKRIDDLLSRMTLEEKILQLNQYTLGRNNNVNNVGEEVKKVQSTPDMRASCADTAHACSTNPGFHEQACPNEIGYMVRNP